MMVKIMSDFSKVGLYDHNQESYKKVKEAFDKGENIVGIVHATGTGKTYNALQLALDNKDKKIIYIVPSNGIIEHIKKIINDNPNLDIEKDFSNLEFRTYQSLVNLSREELVELDMDMMILDEFHHIGAPVWGARINQIIETHLKLKIFGMTAYTVRDRGTIYERDMANPEGKEIFSNKIVSRYDLCDAMIDGVLPKPIYKSAHIHLFETEQELEKRVSKLNENSKDYEELIKILKDIRKRIAEASGIKELVKKNVKKDGKYICFCPPMAEDGTNDIEKIKEQALEWFKEYVPEEDIIFYTSTSAMGEVGEDNREAFYNDKTLDGKSVDGKLRVMFAINQYNEGIHAPNVDGVIMGRGTQSDIVYFEQLGRALAVRGATKEKYDEYDKLTKDELIKICNKRDILLKGNITKEEIIEILLSPVVIDLANNYDYIKELENNLQNRIKEIQESKGKQKRKIKLRNATFDIEVENQELFEMLRYISDRLTKTWEDYYELANVYYEHHGNLEFGRTFKTINGYDYDENGIRLGKWVYRQRQAYFAKGTYQITPEKKLLLENIGMIWDVIESKWQKMYEIAKMYYEQYGHLKISDRDKAIIEDGKIVIVKETDSRYNDKNIISLGKWINNQRQAFKGQGTHIMSPKRKILLDDIGMIWDAVESKWQKMYEIAKMYYEQHGNLAISIENKVLVENDSLIIIRPKDPRYNDKNAINLGGWINKQRQAYDGKSTSKMTPERQELLENIGMLWDPNESKWQKMYEIAKIYYEQYGYLSVSTEYKVKIEGENLIVIKADDPRYNDEDAIELGKWINRQRQAYLGTRSYKMTPERKAMLENIGMIWVVKVNKEKISDLCNQYKIDIKNNKSIFNKSYNEVYSKIMYILELGINLINEDGELHEIFYMSDANMQEKYNISLEELIKKYCVSDERTPGV